MDTEDFDFSSAEQSAGDTAAPQKPSRKRRRLVRRKVRARSERIGCTSCGSPIEIKNAAQAEMITCQSCGSVLDLESDEHEILDKILLDKRPRSVLDLGRTGRIKGAEWEVIGRLRMRDGVYLWNEYHLFSPEAGYAWLQLENGHWVFMRKSKKKPRFDPKSASVGASFHLLGRIFKVAEKSSAEIDYIEGEFTFQAKRGDTVGYMDAVDPPHIACAEWNDRELEWLTGQYMSPETIQKGFKLKTIPSPRGVHKCQPFNLPPWRKTLAMSFGGFAALFLVLTIASLFFGTKTNEFRVSASAYLKQKNQEGYLSKPIEVEQSTICQLKFRAPVKNSWVYLQGLLLDEDEQPLLSFAEEISYYHGRSGGESWSEGSTRGSQIFRIDKPGTYRLALRGEGGRGNRGRNPRGEPVTVRVYQGVVLQRYFIIAMLLCAIVPVFELLRYQKFKAEKQDD
jgi:ribosomal protein S27E